MIGQRILIVEEGFRLLAVVGLGLRAEGYEVITARRGEEALRLASRGEADLIISDARLPDMSGAEMCRKAQSRETGVPVVLVAREAREADIVDALEAGAEDYIVGPVRPMEISARVRSKLRHGRDRKLEGPSRYSFDGVEVDFDHYRATRKGKPVKLTPRESEILRLLVSFRGQLVTRHRLINEVLGDRVSVETRSVDNHILRLRQKLEDTPEYPKHILSVYGRGYKFVD